MMSVAAFSFCLMQGCGKDDDTQANTTPNNTVPTQVEGYVNLGLPSGTLWKEQNETNEEVAGYDYWTYDAAMALFGNQLPTKEQYDELRNNCQWTKIEGGYEVKGTNGNTIVFPAAGGGNLNHEVEGVGTLGRYWTSSPSGSADAWYFAFFLDNENILVGSGDRRYGDAVRLVYSN